MNTVGLATWSQIVSSAAVLITLIYLSVQTRQTAKLMKPESRQSLIEVDMQILAFHVQFPEIPMNWDSAAELPVEQKYRLWSYLCAFMRSREHQWLQYQQGVLDQAAWAAYHSAIPAVMGSERCRAWWVAFGSQFYEPGFVEVVNTTLDDEPYFGLRQAMDAWK
jgi:hypothetical protein